MAVFALIGYPLTHSFSKRFFDAKFAQEPFTQHRFENIAFPTIQEAVEELRNIPQLGGFCITIPFKQAIIPYLQHISPEVSTMQACNCVVVKNGKWWGYNTDYLGFWYSLQPYLQEHHKRALVLGNGGAAQAVFFALKQHAIAYTVVTRTAAEQTITYEQLTAEHFQQHTLVINTTPLGTFPHILEKPAIPYHFLTPEHLCFDLVYNPAETAFMATALQYGATAANGLQMLHLQAEENARLWLQ
ncbi:MAG: shikimate dehydrogenase [Bacteroidetes bacterium]|nr:MAG: shikimate dehydrogenase [Bacteroidota bacterium]